MAALGRLFVEIGAKTTVPKDLQKAQDSLKAFAEKARQSGQQFLSPFEGISLATDHCSLTTGR